MKVRLERVKGGDRRYVTVEYMEQGPLPTAFDVVRPYLDARQLPRRFVVDRDGTPEVVERYGTDLDP